MAAGQGFKTFTTGEVLTAADVNGYLMQGVGVFTDAANRDAEITSPQEGQFAYLKDTNVTTYYTGSAWANLDTTGMTNPMTTTGDTIYSSSGSTPARLGIGSTGQVLTVAGGLPSWATPAGGGQNFSLLGTGTTTSGSTVTVSGISGQNQIMVLLDSVGDSGGYSEFTIRVNTDSGSNYDQYRVAITPGPSYTTTILDSQAAVSGTSIRMGQESANTNSIVCGYITFFGCNSSGKKVYMQAAAGSAPASGHSHVGYIGGGVWNNTGTVTSISLLTNGSGFNTGRFLVYGSA